jgi:hypothetical protein
LSLLPLLYYAVGGGLGHLTRARAWLHTRDRTTEATIITASAFAQDHRVVGDIPVITIPESLASDPVGYRRWLATTIDRYAPKEIVLDAFPCGILGEFADASSILDGIVINHVARLLRWHVYSPLLEDYHPQFTTTWRVEPLAPEHDRWLREHSEHIVDIDLIDPPIPSPDAAIATLREIDSPIWLVVHSGPASEIDQLLAYAEEMKATERSAAEIVLIAPIAPTDPTAHLLRLDIYPVVPLFPLAERIITGRGFNIMRQTRPWRHLHRSIPFPRRYDDQMSRKIS